MEDLYKKMVVAGSRARARGQHSLKAHWKPLGQTLVILGYLGDRVQYE